MVEKFMVEEFMVEEFMVEEFMVEEFMVKNSHLKCSWLKSSWWKSFGVESWVWKVRGWNVQQPFHMSSSSIFNFLKFIWSSKIVNNCNFWISVHQFKFEWSQFQVRICTGYSLSEWFINPKYIIRFCWISKLFVWKLFKNWGSISFWERSICFALFLH